MVVGDSQEVSNRCSTHLFSWCLDRRSSRQPGLVL